MIANHRSLRREILHSGAGALGCAIGAALSEAGHETWLLNRGRAHVEAMNQHGLRVQDERGERYVPVNAAIDAEDVGVTDLVVVLVKSFHTAEPSPVPSR